MDITGFKSDSEIDVALISKGVNIMKDCFTSIIEERFPIWMEFIGGSKESKLIDDFENFVQTKFPGQDKILLKAVFQETHEQVVSEFKREFYELYMEVLDSDSYLGTDYTLFTQQCRRLIQTNMIIIDFQELVRDVIREELQFLTQPQRLKVIQIAYLVLHETKRPIQDKLSSYRDSIVLMFGFFHCSFYLAAHIKALEKNYTGRIPIPVPLDWNPDIVEPISGKTRLNASMTQTVACIVQCATDEAYNIKNYKGIARVICNNFSFTPERGTNTECESATFEAKLKDFFGDKTKKYLRKVPENKTEVIALIHEIVKKSHKPIQR